MVRQVRLERTGHDRAREDQGIADTGIFPGGPGTAAPAGIPFPAHPLGRQRLGDRRLSLGRDTEYLVSQWCGVAIGHEPGIVVVDEGVGVRLAIAVIEALIGRSRAIASACRPARLA